MSQKNVFDVIVTASFIMGLLYLCASAEADIVYLKNGEKIECEITNENKDSISVKIPGGEFSFKKTEVEEVVRMSDEEKDTLQKKWEHEEKKNIAASEHRKIEHEKKRKRMGLMMDAPEGKVHQSWDDIGRKPEQAQESSVVEIAEESESATQNEWGDKQWGEGASGKASWGNKSWGDNSSKTEESEKKKMKKMKFGEWGK